MFTGHSGYVHCVCVRSGGNILSGAEDGTVKMWGESGLHGGLELMTLCVCVYVHLQILLLKTQYSPGNQLRYNIIQILALAVMAAAMGAYTHSHIPCTPSVPSVFWAVGGLCCGGPRRRLDGVWWLDGSLHIQTDLH